MKKLMSLLLLIPIISIAQVGSNSIEINVYDSSGNDLGTYRIESNYIGLGDGNGGINLNAYLRYLKNRGFIEDVQKQEQAMIDRARELGVNANPSAIAFREGYNLYKYGNKNGAKDVDDYDDISFEYNGKKDKLLQLTAYFSQVKTEVISKALTNSGLTKYNEVKQELDLITNNLQYDLSEVKKVKHKIIIYEDYIKKVKAVRINNN